MNDRDLDRALGESPPLDPSLKQAVEGPLLANLKPVRPLEPRWLLAAELIVAAAAVGLAGAWRAGLFGVQRLSGGQAAAIGLAWVVLIALAALASTAAMIPGARQWVRPAPLTAIACVWLAGLFAIVFTDYSTAGFVPQGIRCLKAGLLDAAPAGLLVWLAMHRGFAASGAAAGLVAGLAGFLMLELHCPLLEAPHAMVWHVGVVLISAAVGAVAGGWKRS